MYSIMALNQWTRSNRRMAFALAMTGIAVTSAVAQVSPARVLSQLDVNRDGLPDLADVNGDGTKAEVADSDGDGLPDFWEIGGLDVTGAVDSTVPFPRPSPVVPGTAATPLFSRDQVRTSAGAFDTDVDGLSDFVEVFGLKFIDDNGNGRLDADEWFDANGDGLPSPGEFPLAGTLRLANGQACTDCFDFDGFVFTDPTNPDTDGDGILDGADNDPLVNPRAFGQNQAVFTRGNSDDVDEDNDGLGNGMDLGNDRIGRIDNPTDLIRVISLFRNDLRRQAGGTGIIPDNQVRVPEGLMEDLLGADWNGDGLFRVTDVRDPHFGIVLADYTGDGTVDFPEIQTTEILASALFAVDSNGDGTVSAADFATTAFPDFPNETYFDSTRRGAANARAPLPYQELLLNGAANNAFLPDLRIWLVLYSWRMPGFDIDGNGYIGYDSRSNTNDVQINGIAGSSSRAASDQLISADASSFALDGQVEVTDACGLGACGALGFTSLALTCIGIPLTRPRRRR